MNIRDRQILKIALDLAMRHKSCLIMRFRLAKG